MSVRAYLQQRLLVAAQRCGLLPLGKPSLPGPLPVHTLTRRMMLYKPQPPSSSSSSRIPAIHGSKKRCFLAKLGARFFVNQRLNEGLTFGTRSGNLQSAAETVHARFQVRGSRSPSKAGFFSLTLSCDAVWISEISKS